MSIAPGDRVLHIGCGTGYSTAIIAELVGPNGRVLAHEPNPRLAKRLAAKLRPWPWVTTTPAPTGDGGTFNVVFVTAGVNRPLSQWLQGLEVGGRMLLHFTCTENVGGFAVRIERYEPTGPRRWLARSLGSALSSSFPEGRDDGAELQLRKLCGSEKVEMIRWASTLAHEHGEDWCLVHTNGFCLQGDP
jgi:protein-L-isoaspartate(D-aspartate) O-methyltransferase